MIPSIGKQKILLFKILLDICTENSFIQNSFCVHIIWIISVLSLMPKGEIVGIKLVLPSVTTLITVSTGQYSVYRAIQCLPGNTVSTEFRVMQCLPSSGFHRVYRGTTFTE